MKTLVESTQCSLCGRWLPLTEYHKDKRSPNGRASACKECRRQKARPHYEKYGLSAEVYQFLVSQDVCPLCQKPVDRWVIDHDHDTGQVRGALCANCNTGIGMFSDDIDTLNRAIAYLELAKEEWGNK